MTGKFQYRLANQGIFYTREELLMRKEFDPEYIWTLGNVFVHHVALVSSTSPVPRSSAINLLDYSWSFAASTNPRYAH